MKKEIICGIYCIENVVSSKKYIGKSKNIKSRWSGHRSDLNKNKHHSVYLQRAWNKYGEESFIFTTLEECDINDLPNREMYYIEKYNTTDVNFGYNMCGNTQLNIEYSQETIKNMRESQYSIPILQIDINGNIIKRWEYGCRHAAKETGISQSSIWKCCNKENVITSGGFIWILEKDYNNFDISSINNSQIIKKIVQLDFDFNLINTFTSPKQASKEYGFDNNAISKCIRHKTVSHGGYFWFYEEEFLNGSYLKNKRKQTATRVDQYTLDFKFIKTWDKIVDASKFVGVNESSIRQASKIGRPCAGFIWIANKKDIRKKDSDINIILN